MSGTEWLLLVLVIVVPLALAVIVTKWTLDQALQRSRKNRRSQSTAERAPTPLAPEPSQDHLSTTD